MITKKTGATQKKHQRFQVSTLALDAINNSDWKEFITEPPFIEIPKDDTLVEFEGFVANIKTTLGKNYAEAVTTVQSLNIPNTEVSRALWMHDREGFFSSSIGWVSNTGEKTPTEDKKTSDIGVDMWISNMRTVNPFHPVVLAHDEVNSLSTHALMNRGNILEEVAVSEYEVMTGYTTYEVGFANIENSRIGTSIDRLIEDDEKGGVEAKCPRLYGYMDDNLYLKYYGQIQQHCFVHKLDWIDFIVYFPNMPIKITRVDVDHEFIFNMVQSEQRMTKKSLETFAKMEALIN